MACSFAQLFSTGPKGYVYVFGLPYMTNRISINSEHDLVNIRLLSISPPDALRPYFQEGYLAGTEDITTEYFSKEELDFNNRLIAKFEIPSRGKFWGPGFSMIPDSVLFPKTDRVKEICDSIKLDLKNSLLPGQLGQFMQEWTDLENEIMDKAPRKDRYVYSFRNAVNALMNSNVITDNLLSSLNQLRNFRNLVVHEPKKVNPIELEEKIRETKELRIILKKNNN